jgi:hypothetical protein
MLQGVGALVEVDTGSFEANTGNRSIFAKTPTAFERFVRLAHRENRIADHLTAEWGSFSQCAVRQVVERDPIPTAMLLDDRDKGITRRRVRCLQSLQGAFIFFSNS